MAWLLYTNDNGDRLVGAHTTLSGGRSAPGYASASVKNKVHYYSWVERPQREDGHRADFYPTLENEQWGIKRGLLFPYVQGTIDVYHCRSDRRLREGLTGWRSYSIAGAMNGYWLDDIPVVEHYSQVRLPSDAYVFVEEKDLGSPGYNLHAWQLRPTGDSWIDPVAVWHGDSSILAFADGSAIRRRWQDRRTIDYSNDRQSIPAEQPDNPDLRYMQERWGVRRQQ